MEGLLGSLFLSYMGYFEVLVAIYVLGGNDYFEGLAESFVLGWMDYLEGLLGSLALINRYLRH